MKLGSYKELIMSPLERANAAVLIMESDPNDRNNLRLAIKTVGFNNISDAPNHAIALEKIQQRKITHLIFDAKATNIPTKEFLKKVFALDPLIVALPSSYEPRIDEVFDLLIIGARGYVVKPFTSDSIDAALVNATKGEPISDAVLTAKDRNEALTALMMASLDKCATVMRQAAQFETAQREIPRARAAFARSAELARTFCKGGDEGLLESLEKFCIERGKGPASKLGRLRKRLHVGRNDEEQKPA